MEPTAVLMLNKEPFMRTVGDIMKKLYLNQIESIQRLPLFNEWTLAKLATLYKHVEKLELKFSNPIYEEGDSDTNIYLVTKGEVEVLLAQPR